MVVYGAQFNRSDVATTTATATATASNNGNNSNNDKDKDGIAAISALELSLDAFVLNCRYFNQQQQRGMVPSTEITGLLDRAKPLIVPLIHEQQANSDSNDDHENSN
mmetsp:Transcript_18619/g.31359  ORF Transcript_18619/g.31359 Transcript_18619/m.31359 type:complete len:107 (+) Transcript_18619:1121-1441(+)